MDNIEIFFSFSLENLRKFIPDFKENKKNPLMKIREKYYLLSL